jgi:CHRD domain
MRRTMLFGAAVMTVLAGTAVSLAATAEDDYGYGTTATTTGTTTSGVTTTGGDDVVSFKSTLSAKVEVPKPNAPAKAAGNFTATITERRGQATIRWTLTFRRLSGAAVAAHIHRGAPGVAGPVVVALCGPCRNGQNGRRVVDEDLAAPFANGRYYVNVHTAKNAAGEIRGQLRRVGS